MSSLVPDSATKASLEKTSEKNNLKAKKQYVEDTLYEINEGIKQNPDNNNLQQARLMLEHVQLRIEVRQALQKFSEFAAPELDDTRFAAVRSALAAHEILSKNGASDAQLQNAREIVQAQLARAQGSSWTSFRDAFTNNQKIDEQNLRELTEFAQYGDKAPMGLSVGLKTLMARGFGEVSLSERGHFDRNLVEGLLNAKNVSQEVLNNLKKNSSAAVQVNETKNSQYLIEIQTAIKNVETQRLNALPEPLKNILKESVPNTGNTYRLDEDLQPAVKKDLTQFQTTKEQVDHLKKLQTQITAHREKVYVKKSSLEQSRLNFIDRIVQKELTSREKALQQYDEILATSTTPSSGFSSNLDLDAKSLPEAKNEEDEFEQLKNEMNTFGTSASILLTMPAAKPTFSELAKMSKEKLNDLERQVDKALSSPLADNEKTKLLNLKEEIKKTRQENIEKIPKELKDLSKEIKGKNKSYLITQLKTRNYEELDILDSQSKLQLADDRVADSPSDSRLLLDTVAEIKQIKKIANDRYKQVMEKTENLGQLSNDQLQQLAKKLDSLEIESQKKGTDLYSGLSAGKKLNLKDQKFSIGELLNARREKMPAEITQFLKNSDYIKPQLQNKNYDELVEIRKKAKNEAKISHHLKSDKSRLNKISEAADEIIVAEHQHVVSLFKQATGKNEIVHNDDDVKKTTKDHLKNATDEQLQKISTNAQKIIDQKLISKEDQNTLENIQLAILAVHTQRKLEQDKTFIGVTAEAKDGVMLDPQKLREKDHGELKVMKDHIITAKQRAAHQPQRIEALNKVNETIVNLEKNAKKQYDNAMEKASDDKIAKLDKDSLEVLKKELIKFKNKANRPGSSVYCLSEANKQNIDTRLTEIRQKIDHFNAATAAFEARLEEGTGSKNIPVDAKEAIQSHIVLSAAQSNILSNMTAAAKVIDKMDDKRWEGVDVYLKAVLTSDANPTARTPLLKQKTTPELAELLENIQEARQMPHIKHNEVSKERLTKLERDINAELLARATKNDAVKPQAWAKEDEKNPKKGQESQKDEKNNTQAQAKGTNGQAAQLSGVFNQTLGQEKHQPHGGIIDPTINDQKGTQAGSTQFQEINEEDGTSFKMMR